jgi:CRP/FNR family cyclic AMP-dependent transcriptional regulator
MTVANNLDINESANRSTQQDSCDSILSQLRGLAQNKLTTNYRRGSVIFIEGEEPRGVYVLCKGRAKVSIASADGKTLVLRVAQPGELLGMNATLTGLPYGATAKALDDCRMDFIPREQLLRLLERDKRAYAGIAEALSHKLRYVVEHTRLLFLSHSAAEKLARLFLSWCDDGGTRTPQGIRIQSRLTHEEIAQMICSSRETVTRLLSDLQQKRILTAANSSILIRNRKALEALAKG